ncbi:MAG TPA: RdgB/HAM1 family non-canonical purine NTP pyrophosphatase [Stellaceae bacterium]|jgi:XTP/dITP diphosphohydrolase|nr:RdgB/HAM1 family non-canonical purine NTP pyrophosphatase [Stellaceae bacterium]
MTGLKAARRRFAGGKLVLASHNAGKLREIAALLEPFGIEVSSAADHGLPEPEETGATFIANAELKAVASAKGTGLPALADDSGLAVTGLDGAPGIYSARWAGETKNFAHAFDRIERELVAKGAAAEDAPGRRAAFICALTLAWPDGHVESFEGRIDGVIVTPGRGDKGFGYDPIFVADGHDRTFAEIDPAQKHAISHRARAFAQLVEACFGRS